MEEYEIDVRKDSVKTMFEKLMQRAYRGNAPEGAYDFASNQIVAKTPYDNYDYAIHYKEMPDLDDDLLSFDPNLVPSTHVPEPVAKSSDSPFSSPFNDTAPAGLFGKALQAHSKLVSLLEHEGHETEQWHDGFKAMWGIDEDVDLDEFGVSLRSSGPAVWGGIKRKPVADIMTNISAKTGVGVEDKKISREKVGENALVDWPRVKASVMGIGLQLVLDDTMYREKPIELNYVLLKKEVPQIPKHFKPPDFKIKKPSKTVVSHEIIKRIAASMSKSLDVQQIKYDGLRVKENATTDFTGTLRALPAGIKLHVKGTLLDNMTYDEIPINDEEVPPEVKFRKKQMPKTMDFIRTYAMAKADEEGGSLIKAKDLRKMIANCELQGHQAIRQLREVIAKILPKDPLLRVFHLARAMGEKDGMEWVKMLCTSMNAPRHSMAFRDMDKLWIAMLNDPDCLISIANEVSIGLIKYETLRIAHPKANKYIRKCLAHPKGVTLGMSMIIEAHKRFWVSRYLNTKLEPKHIRIKKQVFSKLLRTMQLSLDSGGGMSVDEDNLRKTLVEIAKSYVEKRRKFKPDKDELSVKVRQPILQLAHDLDGQINKIIKQPMDQQLHELVALFLVEADKFRADIQDLFRTALATQDFVAPDYYGEQKDDVYEIEWEASDKEMAGSEDETAVITKHKMPEKDKASDDEDEDDFSSVIPSKPVQKPVPASITAADLGDDDDDDSGILKTVNLSLELEDEGVETWDPVVAQILADYPAEILPKDFKKIRDEVIGRIKKAFLRT